MTLQDPLLLAIIFISAGLALGLLAYLATVLLRNRGVQVEAGSEEIPAEDTVRSEAATIPTVALLSADPADLPANPAPEAPTLPTRLPSEVATLLRDPATGELLLKIGERIFRSPADLEGSESLPALGVAAADLLRWVAEAGGKPPAVAPVPQAEPATPVARPPSVVAQINEILVRKAAQEGGKLKSIWLGEGPEGDPRVFYGLNCYRMDEIPDEDVRRLVREAVAEWEAQA